MQTPIEFINIYIYIYISQNKSSILRNRAFRTTYVIAGKYTNITMSYI